MFNKKKKNNKGFTLVELLVVIAIIGILAVVALPTLFKNIDKAKVADLESDISAIKSATMSYVADENKLPPSSKDKAAIIDNLKENLDNISDPYDATYTLTPDPAAGTVVLGIQLREPLSKTAVDKLNKDLGANSVTGNNINVTIVKDAKGLGVTGEQKTK